MNKIAQISLLLVLLMCNPERAIGQDKPAGIFAEQGELAMEITTDWQPLLRSRDNDTLYPGKLTLDLKSGGQLSIDVEVSTRAKSRKKRDVCKFPPLKIYFDKKQMAGTTLHGIKSLKLVTHCSRSNRYDSYYVKEFLIYRAYNEITPLSFRVRSLRVTYTDSEGKRDTETDFAFFIEDVDDLAKRNGFEELETDRIRPSKIDLRTHSLYSMFQYMIGNLDWSSFSAPNGSDCCHNSKLLATGEKEPPFYPVAYDFDASGLVNAHYSLPPEDLKVRRVTDRLYRGFCYHNNFTAETLALFREKKDSILALFKDEGRLKDKAKQKALDYLGKFFELIDDPKKVEREFEHKCLG